MQYTREQLSTFKESFTARRRRQLMVAIPVIAVMVVVAVASDGSRSSLAGIPVGILGTVGILFVVGALGYSFYNWRCPACNRYLGKTINPKFCSKCGTPLA